ncbi:hypothetical protein [Xanthomonas translucens]|uniref:Uncharacterized protein n=3 Tax=Xanthomonas campestris pv. translucens TaxID=343 RepID=A0A120EXP4_XANCT|nr:hypothetical protein [Xanthomonas translucens]KTF39096.1 hypothetical protein OZ12_13970 [Xanthomonas translucens pv. translucens]KWV14042.1 hypothetical protein ATB54_12820 [Xanthomonas translucens]KWV14762.1 hypothetical protein ATB53_12915 [Xanthomonas translucens]MCC8448512.1 hypothetical protein [Xanthomonas translucens pv. translucens]MCS3361250.1 hypothetical protein [Xanthomonas translucens pv. translucens]
MPCIALSPCCRPQTVLPCVRVAGLQRRSRNSGAALTACVSRAIAGHPAAAMDLRQLAGRTRAAYGRRIVPLEIRR